MKTIKIISVILAFMLIMGCSREGFKDSLGQSGGTGGSGGSGSSKDSEEVSEYVFNTEIIDEENETTLISYTIPVATSTDSQAAVDSIKEKIDTIIHAVSKSFALEEGGLLQIYDGVEKNDGSHYSVTYEISYRKDKTGETEKYFYGLVFHASNGDLLALGAINNIDDVISSIKNSSTSEIKDRNEERKAAKREYLDSLSNEEIKELLTFPDGAVTIEKLLDGSFFLKGEALWVVLPCPQDIGGYLEVSVTL